MKFILIASICMVFLSFGAALKDYFAMDLMLSGAIQQIIGGKWFEVMENVSGVGRIPITAIGLMCFAWFLWKKQRPEYLLLGAGFVSLGLNPILKAIVDRPRPSEDMVAIWQYTAGSGFPSGHAYTAVVLLGLAYYLIPRVVESKGIVQLGRCLFVIMIALVGVSRVYLGVHWPSDVVGGFLIGCITLYVLIGFHRYYSHDTEPYNG